jgi:hypothetical protein
MSVLVFHHVGLLTGQPDLARERLRLLGYQCGEPVYDPLQDVELCLCEGPPGTPRMELVTPRPTNLALSRLLRRKDDYGYHVCYRTPGFAEGVQALGGEDLQRIVEVMPPQPAILFGGARVAFYSVPGLGLVELLEQAPAA